MVKIMERVIYKRLTDGGAGVWVSMRPLYDGCNKHDGEPGKSRIKLWWLLCHISIECQNVFNRIKGALADIGISGYLANLVEDYHSLVRGG